MDIKKLQKKKISFNLDPVKHPETKKPNLTLEIPETTLPSEASLKSTSLQQGYARGSSLEPSSAKNKRLHFRLNLPENLRALNCSPPTKTVLSDTSSIDSKICNTETTHSVLRKSYDENISTKSLIKSEGLNLLYDRKANSSLSLAIPNKDKKPEISLEQEFKNIRSKFENRDKEKIGVFENVEVNQGTSQEMVRRNVQGFEAKFGALMMNLEQIFKAKLMQNTLKLQYMQAVVKKIFKSHAKLREITVTNNPDKRDTTDITYCKEGLPEEKDYSSLIRNTLEILNKIRREQATIVKNKNSEITLKIFFEKITEFEEAIRGIASTTCKACSSKSDQLILKSEENQQLQEQIQNLVEERNILQGKIHDEKIANKILNEDNSNLKRQLEIHKNKITLYENVVEENKKKETYYSKIVDEMRENFEIANNRFEKLIESDCFDKINQKLNDSDDRIENLASSLALVYDYKSNLKKRINDEIKNRMTDDFSKERLALNTIIKDLESRILELSQKKRILAAEVRDLTQTNKFLSEQGHNLNDKLLEIQSEYQDLHISHTTLELELNKSEKEIDKLLGEKEIFQSKINDAESKSIIQIKSLKTLIEEEKMKFIDEENHTQETITALKERHDSLFDSYTKNAHLLETLKQQKIETEECLKNCQEQITMMGLDFQKRFESKFDELEGSNRDLCDKLNQEQKKTNDLILENTGLLASIKNYEDRLNLVNEEVSKLKKALKVKNKKTRNIKEKLFNSTHEQLLESNREESKNKRKKIKILKMDEDRSQGSASLKEIKLKSQKIESNYGGIKEKNSKIENKDLYLKETKDIIYNLPRELLLTGENSVIISENHLLKLSEITWKLKLTFSQTKSELYDQLHDLKVEINSIETHLLNKLAMLKNTCCIYQDMSKKNVCAAQEGEEHIDTLVEASINSMKRIFNEEIEIHTSDNKENVLVKLIEEYEVRYNRVKERLSREEEEFLIYKQHSKTRESEFFNENKILVRNFANLQKEYMELKTSLVNQSRAFNESMQEISNLNKKLHKVEQNSFDLEERNALLLNKIHEIDALRKPKSKKSKNGPPSPQRSHNQ